MARQPWENLPSTTTPVSAQNLLNMQNYILQTLGLSTATWSSSGTYAVDDIVVYDYTLYINLTGSNTSTPPSSDTTNWSAFSLLTDNE